MKSNSSYSDYCSALAVPMNRARSTSKLRPSKATSPPRHNKSCGELRSSPGLLAGHFAGGKWSEPPSPATLPKPPAQWTRIVFVNACATTQSADIALGRLLNVQA